MGPAKVRDISWSDNEHVILVNSMTTVLPEFVGFRGSNGYGDAFIQAGYGEWDARCRPISATGSVIWSARAWST